MPLPEQEMIEYINRTLCVLQRHRLRVIKISGNIFRYFFCVMNIDVVPSSSLNHNVSWVKDHLICILKTAWFQRRLDIFLLFFYFRIDVLWEFSAMYRICGKPSFNGSCAASSRFPDRMLWKWLSVGGGIFGWWVMQCSTGAYGPVDGNNRADHQWSSKQILRINVSFHDNVCISRNPNILRETQTCASSSFFFLLGNPQLYSVQ